MSIHDLVEKMRADFEILPAVNALTGCYTTSKAGTKAAAFKTANTCGYEHLCLFGKHELTNEMIYNAAQFLLRYISNWKARFIRRFEICRLTQKALRIWFREVLSDKQCNKITHTTCLFVISFMASWTFYWRYFDRSSSIWIQFNWRGWLTNHHVQSIFHHPVTA